MNRYAKIVCVSVVLMPGIVSAQPGAAAPVAQTVIYKYVDESGRVTYANSPIKGGVRVELEPLTVIPSTPSGSLSMASARAAYNVAPNAPAATQVALATPITNVRPVGIPVAAVAPADNVASAATLNQQRRDETRKRLLADELATEATLLSGAQTRLSEEQKSSGQVRAMRASFSMTTATATTQKPLIAPEIRADIERHFERVRDLQDQIAMHENNLRALHEQLDGIK